MMDEWSKRRVHIPSTSALPAHATNEWLKRRVHIPSTSALPAHAAPVAIASALQGSIDAMNVMHFILLVLKTIFHHHAKFHQKMGPKNDPSMITNMSG